MRRHERLGYPNAVALSKYGGKRLHLHLTKAWQRRDVCPQRGGVVGGGPDARSIAIVVVADMHSQVAHSLSHRARETMDRRLLAKHRLQVSVGDRVGVEAAQSYLE